MQILPCRSVPHVPQQGSSSVECAYFALTSMHWFAEAACDEDGGLRLNLDAACNPEGEPCSAAVRKTGVVSRHALDRPLALHE